MIGNGNSFNIRLLIPCQALVPSNRTREIKGCNPDKLTVQLFDDLLASPVAIRIL